MAIYQAYDATHHKAPDYITSPETVGDLHLVFFRCSDVLYTDDTRELFTRRQRDPIDNGD